MKARSKLENRLPLFLFPLAFSLSTLCFAALTPENRAKLDQAVRAIPVDAAVADQAAQAKVIRSVIDRLKVFQMGLTQWEVRVWSKALSDVKQALALPAEDALNDPEPVEAQGESADDFKARVERYHEAKFLTQDLLGYFRERFPVRHLGRSSGAAGGGVIQACQSPIGGPNEQAGQLSGQVNAACDASLGRQAPPVILPEKGPKISVGELYGEVIAGLAFTDWNIQGVHRLGERIRGGQGDRIKNAMADKVLSKTPLYQPSEAPVVLTEETKWFFEKELSPELLREGLRPDRKESVVGLKYTNCPLKLRKLSGEL